MLIGELADAVGLTPQTIRFYERKGLLPQAPRSANGYRTYDDATRARLRFITVAQTAGLTLAEIRSTIDMRDHGNVPCAHVAELIDTKLADVKSRIEQLTALQAELETLTMRSHVLDPADCTDEDICHILTSRT